MSSLDELEAPMLEIDKDFELGDKLAGLSYHKTSHNTLGLDGTTDFTVFLPWKQWSEDLAYTDDSLDKNGDSVLQEAFKKVLKDGASTDMCFIDFSHLWDGKELPFFNEGSTTAIDDTRSVAKALADAINGVEGDDKQITVRFLIGDRTMGSPEELQTLVEEIFFPSGTPLVNNKKINARLFVGQYSPGYDFQKDSRPVDFLRSNAGKIRDIRNLVRDNLHVDVPKLEDVASRLEKMTDDEAKNVLGPKKISLSWNHGKILAVNGHSLMTGGANYAWESASNKYIIVEQSCKLRGDAAVSAHAWMDYFFNYLNKPHKGDTQSFAKVISLADKSGGWKDVRDVDGTNSQPNAAPMSTQAPYNIHTHATEGVKVLACSQLGDWHGKANDLDYPVQIVQLIKDLVMNILWGVLSKTEMIPADESKRKILQQLPIQAIAVTMVDAFFAEHAGPREQLAMFIGKEVPNPYKFLRINPNAWASRSTRLRAIANAKKEVILVQQRLILPPTKEELKPEEATADTAKAIVPTINGVLNLHDDQSWNGYLWPYDLLLAICYAILPTSRGYLTDKGSADVFIVLSHFAPDPNEADGGWGDAMRIKEFKGRLKLVVRALVALSNLPWIVDYMSESPLTSAQAKQLQAAAKLFGKQNDTVLGWGEAWREKKIFQAGSGDLFTELDWYVENKVHVRRVLKDHEHDYDPAWKKMPVDKKNNVQKKLDIACHCKLVCVDESLMYVGSDNAYPSYNEEHGIWHEDKTAIKEWKAKFWTTLWEKRARTDTD